MQPNRTVPSFSAPASTGMTLSSDAFLGSTPMVIFFLNDTEESRSEFTEVSDRLAEFGARRIQALGIAKVTAAESRRLAEAHGWKPPVLADASGSIRRDFGVDADGTDVFVVDLDGTLLHVDTGTANVQRPASVLALLTDMKSDGRMAETARS